MRAVAVREEPVSSLATYADVSITFTVNSVFDVTDGPAGFILTERRLFTPWTKDYDQPADEHPSGLATRFDLTNFTILAAYRGTRRVGGAIVGYDTPGVNLLESRTDLALLLDLRADTEERGTGIGTALFRAAEGWARAHGCRQLKVETQNVNVGACRFYERMGCRLGAVRRGVYREFPEEEQLFWYRNLLIGV